MTNGHPSRSLTPASEDEAANIVRDILAGGGSLGIAGGNTRSGLGRPTAADTVIRSTALTGITLYEPSELVVGARAGTPIAEVEATLAANGQALAFEPIDHRALFGTDGEPTVGGVVAVNASGPRRIKVGAARDALLGVRFVNGKGETIKSGGRVMKNVTGLDLVKAMCGSYGTLGFMTEAIFKVLPIPERSVTIVLEGLPDERAAAAMSMALGSPYEPSGAAHLPAKVGASKARTLIRIEGFNDSVRHRVDALNLILAEFGKVRLLERDESTSLWRTIRDAALLSTSEADAVWRISVAPDKAPSLTAAIAAQRDARWFYDWGGGLIWLATASDGDAGATAIRSAVAAHSGHATLVRAPAETRTATAVFEPLASPLMKLSAGLKQSIDPKSVFQPGKMYAGV